jgi:hypothetical protein
MNGTAAFVVVALAGLLILPGCGGDSGVSADASTDDGGPVDAADQVDVPVEPVVDGPVDVVPDGTEDPVFEPLPDGLTECEEASGYCTEYAVIPDPCVTCDSTSVTHYRPAHSPGGAMGCTVEGVGGSPWCCLPHAPTSLTDCDTAGGECYPYADPEPCPPGWGMIWSSCGADGVVCCAPASENCD